MSKSKVEQKVDTIMKPLEGFDYDLVNNSFIGLRIIVVEIVDVEFVLISCVQLLDIKNDG